MDGRGRGRGRGGGGGRGYREGSGDDTRGRGGGRGDRGVRGGGWERGEGRGGDRGTGGGRDFRGGGGGRDYREASGGDRGGRGGGWDRGRRDDRGYQREDQSRGVQFPGQNADAGNRFDQGGRGRGGYHQGGREGNQQGGRGGYQQGGRGGYQQGGRGGYQQGGRGGYQQGSRGGRGGGGGGGGRREIDWVAQEKMETASQTSTKSDPEAEAARVKKLNDLPTDLAGEDKNKFTTIPDRINKGPIVGTRGRHIQIEVNHVQLTFDPKKTVAIHYDCAFDRDKLSKKLLRRIMKVMQDRHYPSRNPAFDGKKNLYSCGKTPLFTGPVLHDTVELPPEEGSTRSLKVEVTIKMVEGDKVDGRIDLTVISQYLQHKTKEYPQKAVQVMEIALRNAPVTAGFIQVGRSFFTAPSEPITLGNGMELYHGFFQSVVLGWKTFLNVDVAHKAFPEERVVSDVMCEFIKGYNKPHPSELSYSEDELENFKNFMKGLRVLYFIPGVPNSRRKRTVVGVKPPPNQKSFLYKRNDSDPGTMMKIDQYFQQVKGYRLQFPNLPCLHVGDPKGDICLPPELCTVVIAQVMMKKLDANQTRAMIREAAKPPHDRKQKIMDAMNKVKHNKDSCVNEFGINVGQQLTKVPARILTPPNIEYGNKTVQPDDGKWNLQPFKTAKNLDNWAIVSADNYIRCEDLRRVSQRFQECCRETGMKIAEPIYMDCLVTTRYINHSELQRLLRESFRKYKADNVKIAVVVMPDKDKHVYNIVKKIGDTEVGLPTSCLYSETATKKMNQATAKNLLQKINTKLEGVNHTVNRNQKAPDRVMELLRGTMLMGADVTHPSPDQRHIPSVAAVTASHDPLQFQYNMLYQLQPPKQEIIADLHKIVIKHLKYYKMKNGREPTRIIFYRDGVSEGQFMQVLQVEMTCIKAACRMELGRELPVTFLVVQKRHHTRFFPINKNDMDRKGNVLPGTVVDTEITHPTQADFYLVSHASLQGTSRPTKYHKLWDDNMINEDDLEELTFFLCHMFSRCTRSVSYPAPTYLAHLAAARGKVFLEGDRINLDNLAMEMEKRTIHPYIVNNAPMFFT
ncbi:protein argonaute-2-like [Macrosteles quadrilineatus]|uniref:protein argonaute-2-like n=1 Tax=Macrosteles quadrilineatus TaxID=74068 RepID=UPI0023E20D13|nr:protein argonaute-2-like [Macrosteles quadrilineatus]